MGVAYKVGRDGTYNALKPGSALTYCKILNTVHWKKVAWKSSTEEQQLKAHG